jgi:succinate dehydrogenase / fumarate reductase, flavoprotein subunit
MLDLVVVNGQARGIVCRNLVTGELESHAAQAVLLCTGGYGTVFYLSTNAVNSNVTAAWRAHKKGALLRQPLLHADSSHLHPGAAATYQSKLTLMSESLRNDGRVWVPKAQGDTRPPSQIPEADRDYFLERRYPSFGNLVPSDVASRAAKAVCDEGPWASARFRVCRLPRLCRRHQATGRRHHQGRTATCSTCTSASPTRPLQVPMRIYPAVHYTMGGLWVDYNLMSTMPGLFVLGEANFSDHGANRLGASALMQGLADGYFVIPYTIGGYLAGTPIPEVKEDHDAFKDSVDQASRMMERLLSIRGNQTPTHFHRELGQIMWEHVGMSRDEVGMKKAKEMIPRLREQFWDNLAVPGSQKDLNQALEKANRTADFLEFAELMVDDALSREESCGCHFNIAFQTEEQEALRRDESCSYVSTWEYQGEGKAPDLHQEPLQFEYVEPATRSYK